MYIFDIFLKKKKRKKNSTGVCNYIAYIWAFHLSHWSLSLILVCAVLILQLCLLSMICMTCTVWSPEMFQLLRTAFSTWDLWCFYVDFKIFVPKLLKTKAESTVWGIGGSKDFWNGILIAQEVWPTIKKMVHCGVKGSLYNRGNGQLNFGPVYRMKENHC